MRLFSSLSVRSKDPIADICERISALSPELIPHNSIAQAAVDEALPYDLYCQWISMRLSLSQTDQHSLSVSRRQAIAVFIDLVRRIEDCYVMKFHQNPSQITPEQVHVMQRMTLILMAIAEVLQHRASPGELGPRRCEPERAKVKQSIKYMKKTGLPRPRKPGLAKTTPPSLRT